MQQIWSSYETIVSRHNFFYPGIYSTLHVPRDTKFIQLLNSFSITKLKQ